MSLHELLLDWRLDGPTGAAMLALVGAAALTYLVAARIGERRDRRHRRWPLRRTAAFMAGLALLVIDLYSGIGAEADVRLSAHMTEHMVMWVLVAPLLAAGAPVRLALFALPRRGRRMLARGLHSRTVRTLTSPIWSITLFSTVIIVTHVPTVYGLALGNDYAHEVEHALYLLTALLVWVPILRIDPFPHRPSARGQTACMLACMVPMALVAAWLGAASSAVYGHYLGTLGPNAAHDQHVAAAIMWLGGLPAFAVPVLSRVRLPQRKAATLGQSVRVSA